LKKRTKKLFHLTSPLGASCITRARRQEQKFFASFFKKKRLPCLRDTEPTGHVYVSMGR
jgi:hypothetical protein